MINKSLESWVTKLGVWMINELVKSQTKKLAATEPLCINGPSTANQILTLLCTPITVILFHEQWWVQNGREVDYNHSRLPSSLLLWFESYRNKMVLGGMAASIIEVNVKGQLKHDWKFCSFLALSSSVASCSSTCIPHFKISFSFLFCFSDQYFKINTVMSVFIYRRWCNYTIIYSQCVCLALVSVWC